MNLTDYNRMASVLDGRTFPEISDDVKSAEDQRDGVVLVCAADIQPVPIRWLWNGWLARGKLHIMAGAPGQGKTTISMKMAATVSCGGSWPDGSQCAPGNVLIWSGEDDPGDTLVPRLLASGADRSRCHFVSGMRIAGKVQPFDPARDMSALEARAREIGEVRLLIVDPVVSVVGGDSHKNTEVRRALQPLVDLAAQLDAAVLGISHFNKSNLGGDPMGRLVGSVAFAAVARIVLVAAKVKSEDGADQGILARCKSNLGKDSGGFKYHVHNGEPAPGVYASHIKWGSSVEGCARDLLSEAVDQEDGNSGGYARAEAEEFLIQLLNSGPSPTTHIQTEAKAAGIAWRTIRRASDVLSIKKRKLNGIWYWSRPEGPAQPVQRGQLVQGLSNGQPDQFVGQVAGRPAGGGTQT